jgi:hypothetical protein
VKINAVKKEKNQILIIREVNRATPASKARPSSRVLDWFMGNTIGLKSFGREGVEAYPEPVSGTIGRSGARIGVKS